MLRRNKDGALETVICRRSDRNLFVLPKGTRAPGERLEETAIREVREETGLEVDLGPYIGRIVYSFTRTGGGVRYEKTVDFFLMSPTGGSISQHDTEFDTVEWLDAAEASDRLTHQDHARILEKALAMAERGAGDPAGRPHGR